MTPLQQVIVERIQREGPIPFADYMRMALYEPGNGYYMSGPIRIGWEGNDYYTSTDVSTFFAHCMARQLYQLWQRLEQPAPFIVLEQGAGRGDLARGVQSWIKETYPELSIVLEYHTEDIRTGHDAGIQVASPTILPSVIISNELVDAFP